MKALFDRVARRAIRRGRLDVIWADGSISRYGTDDSPAAAIQFCDPAAEPAAALNPELALGELYMDGRIAFPGDTILDFLCLANANWSAFSRIPWVAAILRLRFLFRGWIQDNNPFRARKNVAHHYDMDENFYRLFLDRDMQYSCAYFETPQVSLEEAQWAKKRHLAAKMALQPGHEVLDIGCGWGGMGLFLAGNLDVNVTGVTLSTEQHRVANERADALGLGRKARFELKDYRALDRSFDRIVSVGMFEHVGVSHYAEFFRTIAKLLKPDGAMVLHSIGRSDPPGNTNPWLQKYIFPGGYIPALSEVLREIERAGLYVTDIEILRMHYAETLKAWRQRFRSHWDEAARFYDERFCRMWDFYLAGSEAAFRTGGMMVFQIQITRDKALMPLTRDYIHAAELKLDRYRRDESYRIAGG